ncbi:MAG: RNA-directed DNA polymerase [Rhodospirillales bacterium]
MPEDIVNTGIGLSSSEIWQAWKLIRKELRNSAKRDVVDYLEFDISPEVWIHRLCRQVRTLKFEPARPSTFFIAKGGGFNRRMATPSIPDAVLYRAIVDWLYSRASKFETRNAYFERKKLDKAQREAAEAARKEMGFDEFANPYKSTTGFLRWLCFEQFKRHLLLGEPSKFIVITDITNFFDSVLHSRVQESLHQVSAPSKMMGMLFHLLERFEANHSFSASTQIGLAVDEFGCSRTLAHILLLSHDDRMVKLVGDGQYVRWVDDQNFGVASRADGLRIVAAVQSSLAKLNLTANSAKTRVLTLAEARRHFHFDINQELDDAFRDKNFPTAKAQRALRTRFNTIWTDSLQHEGIGEWSKILSRFYRLAGISKSRRLRRRALNDIVRYPRLAIRILDYIRCTGSSKEYLDFCQTLWAHPEQLYADVNRFAFEGIIRLALQPNERSEVRKLARSFITGRQKIIGADECAAIAPLLLLKFGDARSLSTIEKVVMSNEMVDTHELFRCAAIVYCSFGIKRFRQVRRQVAKLPKNNLSEIVRLIEAIQEYKDVPDRFKPRVSLRLDTMSNSKWLDLQSLITLRLLLLNDRKRVRDWVAKIRDESASNDLVPTHERISIQRLLAE